MAETTTESQLDKLVNATNIIDRVANGAYEEVVPTEQGNSITVKKAITDMAAFNPRGPWVTLTPYILKDLVTESGIVYVVVEDHTSGVFATDLSNGLLAVYQTIITENFETLADMITDLDLFSGLVVMVKDYGFYLIQVGQADVTLANGLYAAQVGTRTHINSGVNKLGADMQSLTPALNVVITGDSLGFNGFDYPVGWGVNGSGYATANPFGMQSWAHMLRDLWVSANSAFCSIADLPWHTDCATEPVFPIAANFENYGLNVKLLTFIFADDVEQVIVESEYVGSNALLVSYADSTFAVTFDVDGVPYNNESPNGDYGDRGYLIISAGQNPVVDNVKNKATPTTLGGILDIYGTVGSATKVPKLTAKGGYTSAQVLAEYATLVGAFAPDVVFYIIGANDQATSVPVATFKTNVQDFIDNVIADSSDADIVLMSTPPASSATEAAQAPYVHALKELAIENGCSVIDLVYELNQIDPALYRFDNIHWKKEGDDLVLGIVKKLVFPTLAYDDRKFTPSREAYIGAGISRMKRKSITYSVTIQMTTTTPTVSYASNVNFGTVTAGAYSGSGVTSKCELILPKGFKAASVTAVKSNVDRTDIIGLELITAGEVLNLIRTVAGVQSEIDGSDNYVIITATRKETEV